MTALAALVLAALVALAAWVLAGADPLETLDDPEAALDRVAGRELDLRHGLRAAPAWERRVYALLLEAPDDLARLAAWYEELDEAVPSSPGTALRLAILEGEGGAHEDLRARLAEWSSLPEPFADLAALVEAAYLGAPVDAERARALAAEASAALDGWFRDRVFAALGRAAGDGALVAVATRELDARGAAMLGRARWLLALDLVTLSAGAAALVAIWRRRRPDALRVAGAALPPPWSGRVALAVLLRGGALGGLVLLGLLVVSPWTVLADLLGLDDAVAEALASIAASAWVVPLLLLAQRHLFAPPGRSATAALGLRAAPGSGRALALVTLAALGLGAAGDWLAALAGQAAGTATHWAEWFDPTLVFGRPALAALAIADACCLAPVVEEIAFRGLLHGALRIRFGFAASALASGAVFAAAHGYGAVGFAGVLWSGVVWAWAYERTGSLLPPIIAHSLNNVAVSVAILALYR